MKKISVFVLLLISVLCQSQSSVFGTVKDAISGQILPFATIELSNSNKVIADVDGRFSISFLAGSTLIISYDGYQKAELKVDNNKRQDVLLFPVFNISITAKNRKKIDAENLLKKVIAEKNNNNAIAKLSNFQFKAYNKIIVTANPDSISSKIDTIFSLRKIKKIDSSSYKFKKIVSKNHLFEIEKVSLHQYAGGASRETIIAMNMAGFKKPIDEVLGFELQSFSIYDNYYTLLQRRYFSPIIAKSVKKYDYKILDTIIYQNRKTIVLYFDGKRKSTTLEGVFYIDDQTKGIAKAIYRNRTIIDLSTNYFFTFNAIEKVWMPSRTTFKIVKGQNDEDITILGGTIAFDGDKTKNFRKRKREPSDFVYALSDTKFYDGKMNDSNVISRKYMKRIVQNEAFQKPDSYWDIFNKDSVDLRRTKTYAFMDSLSLKRGVEKKYFFGKKIINGFLPISAVDVDLRKLVNFNNYEGFRVCLALQSNEYFSEKLRLNSYVAYGTRDGEFKYNFAAAARIGKRSSSWIGFSYTDDLREIASTTFSVENKASQLLDTSIFNISSFYNYQQWLAFFESKIIPKTTSIWELSTAFIDPKFNYTYLTNQRSYNSYQLTTAQFSLKWHPFSKYMQTPTNLVEIETAYPKFTFQFTKSLPTILKNDFDFTKIDFKTEYEQQYLDGQVTSLLFSLGFAIGDTPLTHLYNNSPNSLNSASIMSRIAIVGENDFETMYFNEFFSNQYAFFQFKHEFKPFQLSRKMKPNLVVVSRAAIGYFNNSAQHTGLNFKILNEGYLESGLQLNKIFKGAGIGAFYRYGANHLPSFQDNIAVRFSYRLDLGF